MIAVLSTYRFLLESTLSASFALMLRLIVAFEAAVTVPSSAVLSCPGVTVSGVPSAAVRISVCWISMIEFTDFSSFAILVFASVPVEFESASIICLSPEIAVLSAFPCAAVSAFVLESLVRLSTSLGILNSVLLALKYRTPFPSPSRNAIAPAGMPGFAVSRVSRLL